MSLHHQYNGFEVYAHAYEFSRGIRTVGDTDAWQSSEHSGAQVWPACDIFGATKEEASDIAMRYGCDLVDPTHSRLLRHVLCYRCSSYTSDVTPVQLQGQCT